MSENIVNYLARISSRSANMVASLVCAVLILLLLFVGGALIIAIKSEKEGKPPSITVTRNKTGKQIGALKSKSLIAIFALITTILAVMTAYSIYYVFSFPHKNFDELVEEIPNNYTVVSEDTYKINDFQAEYIMSRVSPDRISEVTLDNVLLNENLKNIEVYVDGETLKIKSENPKQIIVESYKLKNPINKALPKEVNVVTTLQ